MAVNPVTPFKFNLVIPQELLVDPQRRITRVWYRFLVGVFNILGSGQVTVSLPQIIADQRAIAYWGM